MLYHISAYYPYAGCMSQIPTYTNLWFELRFYLDNTLQDINVIKLYANIWGFVCKANPAYQAFAGSDYIASFSRKGKVIHLNTLRRMKLLKIY